MRLLAKVSALDGLSGSLRTLALAQLSAESGVWAFLSPKGMDKSAQGCAERTTLGRGPVPLAPSLKGMNTPRRLLSIPFREWEGGYMALPG